MSSPAAASARRSLFGLILVLVSALGFAAGSSAAVIAYQSGATPVSLMTTRLAFTIVALYLFVRATGGTPTLRGRDRRMTLLMGFLMGTQGYCLLAAVGLVPVALAVLTFYFYPLLIGLGVHITGQERVTPVLAGALVLAFGGLVLALDVTGGGLDPLGIGLALTSAVVMAIYAIVTRPIIDRAGDSRSVTLVMHYTALPAFMVADVVLGEFPLPTTGDGWIAFAAVLVFYTIAVTAFFSAVGMIGPVRTSLGMNLEPIFAIVFGFVMLGQVLTWKQLLGAAIVIGAVFMVKLQGFRPRRAYTNGP